MSELTREYFETHLDKELMLTKEHFDQRIQNLNKRMDQFVTKDHLEEKLNEKLKETKDELKAFIHEENETLALMVKIGFDEVDKRFDEQNKKFGLNQPWRN